MVKSNASVGSLASKLNNSLYKGYHCQFIFIFIYSIGQPRFATMSTMKTTMMKLVLTMMLTSFCLVSNGGTIFGTSHDLGTKGWGTTETCKFCHAPHQNQAVANAPLWNRTLTVQTYVLYGSPSYKGKGNQPGVESLMCLSCHDGTVALDSFGNGGIIQQGTHMIGENRMIGGKGTLAHDHPIAFAYDAALLAEDNKLVQPVSAAFVDASHNIPLYATKMECASCHDPHDNGFGNFLRMDNSASGLCIKCHLK